jgi:hypothetical protein
MRDCTTVSTDNAPLKPNKRVSYPFGMVLGADDFRQEQQHHEWKSRLSNLLLHGSGTVCGLRVTPREDAGDIEIRVTSGYAVSPHGNWIWVEKELCARLGEWIARNAPLTSPPMSGPQTLYVNLCYDECATDLVPIAGQPCANDEDSRAPSRILETARAEFSWTQPSPAVERQFRAFGDIMMSVEIADGVLSPDDSQHLIDLVRNLGATITSPPLPLSPPVGTIRLSGPTACETIREALAVWTTEVCPTLEPAEGSDDCVMLACVRLELDGSGALINSSVEVNNCERPVLVPDRLKQELFCINSGKQGPMGPEGQRGPAGERGADGAPGAPGTGLESELTHICGINWTHAGSTVTRRFTFTGVEGAALAVAFSGPVQSGDLNALTVRVLTDTAAEAAGTYRVACECPIQADVRPAILDVELSPEGTCLILGVRRVFEAGTQGERVNGVLLLLRSAEFGRRLIVQVKGDFIRDQRNVSVDANHLAPWLPNRLTGDSIAGGLFESWFTPVEALPIRPNINLTDLRGLLDAGLTPDIARRIIEERGGRIFANATDARTRLRMNATEFREISALTTIG